MYKKDGVKFKAPLTTFGLTVVLSGFLAVVMYNGLLSNLAQLKNDLLVLSVVAQNGFFRQTLIDKLSEENASLGGSAGWGPKTPVQ